jgi:trimethylamine:corrinoid methyltransferase-like protein
LEDHTVDHMLDQHFYPQHGVRMPFDVWIRDGEPTIVSRAREHVKVLLADRKAVLDRGCLSRIARQFPQIQAVGGD